LERRELLTIAGGAYVTGLYGALLQRPPDPGGLDHWTGLLNAGTDPGRVVLGIEASPEYRLKFVQDDYAALLKRSADQQGQDAFVSWLDRGATTQQVTEVILGSPEYLHNAGGNPSGFLTAVYREVLARDVDGSGLATFGQALSRGVSRADIAAALLDSPEGERLEIQGLYQRFLHRPAGPSEVTGWAGILAQGVTSEQFVAGVLSSVEYQNQLATLSGNGSILGVSANGKPPPGPFINGGLPNSYVSVQDCSCD
jgi:hypothetical protein